MEDWFYTLPGLGSRHHWKGCGWPWMVGRSGGVGIALANFPKNLPSGVHPEDGSLCSALKETANSKYTQNQE